ncbi:MAG: hypothetical protein FWH22_06120 [Fibromonadales bacterium]|nr:hypothetical protein [Fibromonadales bacterium]
MLTVQGLYENGIVKVREPVPSSYYEKSEVFVIFLPTAYKKEQEKENRFPGMDKPVRLGFDLKKMSREELYER